jgi:hypothetical protein
VNRARSALAVGLLGAAVRPETTTAVGLTIPPSVCIRADEVIQ